MSTGIQNSDGKVMEEGKGPPECRRGRRDSSKREADGRRRGGCCLCAPQIRNQPHAILDDKHEKLRSFDISASVPQAVGLPGMNFPFAVFRLRDAPTRDAYASATGPLSLSSATVPLPCDLLRRRICRAPDRRLSRPTQERRRLGTGEPRHSSSGKEEGGRRKRKG